MKRASSAQRQASQLTAKVPWEPILVTENWRWFFFRALCGLIGTTHLYAIPVPGQIQYSGYATVYTSEIYLLSTDDESSTTMYRWI